MKSDNGEVFADDAKSITVDVDVVTLVAVVVVATPNWKLDKVLGASAELVKNDTELDVAGALVAKVGSEPFNDGAGSEFVVFGIEGGEFVTRAGVVIGAIVLDVVVVVKVIEAGADVTGAST